MARTDYGAILSTVIEDTSDSIREVNGTVGLIAPNQWGANIRTMKSASDYENALEQMIEETATGDIASFSDGANNIPVKSLTCTINPVQDLHGQDYPYPSGGGKNILEPIAVDTTSNNVRVIGDSDGKVTISGTASADTQIEIYSFVVSTPDVYTLILKDNLSGSNDTYWLSMSGVGVITSGKRAVFSFANTGTFKLRINVKSGAVTNFTVYPMVAKGNVDIPYAPYSNICPITGHTELNLVHTGKNLFEVKPFSDWTSVGSYKALKKCLPANQSMVMSFSDKDTTIDISDVYLGFLTSSWSGGGGTAPSTSDYRWCLSAGVISSNTSNRSVSGGNLLDSVFIYPNTETAYNKLFARYNIQIELGSSATTYEAYTGTTTTTDLGTTVYGGTLDPVSGVLTTDRGMIKLSDINWTAITSNPPVFRGGLSSIPNIQIPPNNAVPTTAITESFGSYAYSPLSSSTIGKFAVSDGGSNRIVFIDDSVNTLGAFLEKYGDDILVYPLATPTTTQLTPQEVKSLLGSNNIYHDCNGQVAVTYRANGQLYVEQHT